ncbi:MAG: restriction endonuclease subunit S [Melioribacteraceae bacterium]
MKNWSTIKISELSDKNIENSFVDGDWIESEHIINEGIRIIQTGNIGIGRYIDKTDSKKFISYISFNQLKCKKVLPGDLLICRLADPIGRCCIVPNDEEYYVTVVDVVILRPNSNHLPNFLLYFLNDANVLKAANDKAAGSTRQRVSRTNFGKLEITIPPYQEQTMIAEILFTADEAIEQTEKLIAKYQRIKTGLMQDLLTRGIDKQGNVRNKATHKFVVKNGIEVPEEWDVISIQDFASKKKYAIVDGPFGSNLKIIHYRSSGVPVIQSGFVTANKFVAKEYLFVDKEKLEQEIRSKVEPGDIVMAKIGANCGTCAILPDDHPISIIAGNCLKITVGNNNSNRYLEILLHFLYDYRKFDDIKSTTAQPAISMAQLKEYKIAQPSKDEQLKIVNILDSIDATIADTNDNLSKIISIKTGLMQDLLSGRVRVKVE